MKRKYIYLPLLLYFCCLSLPSPSYSALPESINLIQTYPFLKDISSYYQVIDLKKHKPDINFLGSAAVGNGYCFGLIGTKFPQNTIYGLIGPDYETDERFFSNVSTLVKLNKKTLSATHQSVYKVKRSAIVLTEETFDEGLTLYTVTFAPPDKRYILRINIIKNNSSKDIEDLTILMKFSNNNSKKLQNFLYQKIKDKFMTAGFLTSEAKIKDGEILLHLGKLLPGEEIESNCIFGFSYQKLSKNDIKLFKSIDARSNLKETFIKWQKWFKNNTLTLNSNWAYLSDLIDDTNVLLKVQQAASGAISVMAKYSGMWCRDSFGPIRFLLLNGNYSIIKEILEYYDYATRLLGFRNRYPVDLNFTPKVYTEAVNWNNLTPQQGDDPNLLILQFYSYFKETGDLTFIKEHYPFLKRNLLGQHIGNDFLLPFHGDETYQVYALHTFYKPLAKLYSADTAFEYVTAGRGMKKIAEKLNLLSDSKRYNELSETIYKKTENIFFNLDKNYYYPAIFKDNLLPYQFPFLNINLRPFWINYISPYRIKSKEWKKQRKNVTNSLKLLKVTPDNIVTSKRSRFITGMIPGYLLYNLSVINSPDADKIFSKIVEEYAAPLGEFSENYQRSKKRLYYYTKIPTNYRPWESAINVSALLFYLTGAFYDDEEKIIYLKPRIPESLNFIEIGGIFIGGIKLRMRFENIGGKLVYKIENMSEKSADIHCFVLLKDKSDKVIINGNEVAIEDDITYDEEFQIYIIEVPIRI